MNYRVKVSSNIYAKKWNRSLKLPQEASVYQTSNRIISSHEQIKSKPIFKTAYNESEKIVGKVDELIDEGNSRNFKGLSRFLREKLKTSIINRQYGPIIHEHEQGSLLNCLF